MSSPTWSAWTHCSSSRSGLTDTFSLAANRFKTLFETDASERVRLHAFAALRRRLEAAVLVPSAVPVLE